MPACNEAWLVFYCYFRLAAFPLNRIYIYNLLFFFFLYFILSPNYLTHRTLKQKQKNKEENLFYSTLSWITTTTQTREYKNNREIINTETCRISSCLRFFKRIYASERANVCENARAATLFHFLSIIFQSVSFFFVVFLKMSWSC